MITVKLLSPSKINITLDILGKDTRSGKHFVNTILYRDDSLCDEIEFRHIGGKGNLLICDDPDVPENESNLILQALKILNVNGWEIKLLKRIPVFSGLGGGSSNAGITLKYFGKKLGYGVHELEQIATKIGSDVPFFVQDDNLVYCEGFGDQVVQSWSIDSLKIEYINTGIRVSTAEAYLNGDGEMCGTDSVKTEMLLQKLNESRKIQPEIFKHVIHNDFEFPFFESHPEWKEKGFLCGSGGMMWRFWNTMSE